MLFFAVALAGTSQAQDRKSNVGLGVMIGEPTGFTLKSWVSPKSAFDVGLAWSFNNDDNLYVHADYLWHNYNVFRVEQGSLPLYYGVGGRILFANDPKIGVRIPIGMEYQFEDNPLGIFLEIGPIVDIAPDTDFDGSGGIGIRYYF